MQQMLKTIFTVSASCRLGRIAVFLIFLLQCNVYVQAQNNYTYDDNGRLTSDLSEGIVKIEWNNMGKVTRIIRADTSHMPDVEFAYDAMGHRNMKLVKPRSGSGLMSQSTWRYAYYTFDNHGNTMVLYERNYEKDSLANGSYKEEYKMAEQHVYATRKLGYRHSEQRLVKHYFIASLSADGHFENNESLGASTAPVNSEISIPTVRGRKQYQIQNHADNVLAVVGDRLGKFETLSNTNKAELVSASDYYPFGMEISSRQFRDNAYRYGFNGMEKDNEIKGSGNSLDFEARFYDPRLGRFLSLDPMQIKYPSHSSFNYALNSPLMFNDPSGEVAKYTISGNNIVISSTIYVSGSAANTAMVNDMNAAFKAGLKPGTYFSEEGKLYNISFQIKAVLEPTGLKQLKPGENRYNVESGDGRSYIDSKTTGTLYPESYTGEYGPARRNAMYVHETLHLVGLSDRYIEESFYHNIPLIGWLIWLIENWQHTEASIEDIKSQERDIMGTTNSKTMIIGDGAYIAPSTSTDNINQVHYNNLGRAILEQAKEGSTTGYITKTVDTDGCGKLIGRNLTPKQEADRRSAIGAGLDLQSQDFLRRQELNKEDFKGPYRP